MPNHYIDSLHYRYNDITSFIRKICSRYITCQCGSHLAAQSIRQRFGKRIGWFTLCGGLLARSARRIEPHIRRVRGCLTLMLAAAANATATPAPARLTGLRMSHSACLSLPRARVERFRFAHDFSAIHQSRFALRQRAGRQGNRVCDASLKLARSHRLRR
jgi:hypothetical protein